MTTLTITSAANIGENLLELVKSERYPEQLVTVHCRNGETRKAHSAVLLASSTYFAKVAKNGSVKVPFSGEIFDILLEYFYTTRGIGIEVDQAIQLYAAANILNLTDLVDWMQNFFLNSNDFCVNDESFLSNDLLEDVCHMTDIFCSPAFEHNRLLLVKKLYAWGQQMSISSESLGKIVSLVLGVTPREAGHINNITRCASPRIELSATQDLVLIVGKDDFSRIVNNTLRSLENPGEPLVNYFGSSNPMVLKGEKFYLSSKDTGIITYSCRTGKYLEAIDDSEMSLACSLMPLIIKHNRVYTWVKRNIYEIIDHSYIQVCQTSQDIQHLTVRSHQDGNFTCLYQNYSEQIFSLEPSADGELNEIPWSPKIQLASETKHKLIGCHNDMTYLWRETDTMSVIVAGDNNIRVMKALHEKPKQIATCENQIYLLYDTEVQQINAETGVFTTIEGHVREGTRMINGSMDHYSLHHADIADSH